MPVLTIASILVVLMGFERVGQVVPVTHDASFQARGAPSRAASAAIACAQAGRDTRPSTPPRALHIRVNLQNNARIEPSVLAAALLRVDSVFHRAGIAVRWTDEASGTDTSPLFDVVLAKTAPPSASTARAVDGTLGHANQAAYRAYAYSDAIRTAAAAFHTAPAYLLGDVIAHELGHLILPTQGHSDWGIMRPDILRSGLPRSFGPREAEMIASRVGAHAVGRYRPEPYFADSIYVETLTVRATPGAQRCRATVVAEWRCPMIDAAPFSVAETRVPDRCR